MSTLIADYNASLAKREASALQVGEVARREAEGVRKVLDAKAEGYRALVESCRGDAKSAATPLLVEKIENLVAYQVEAIKNIKIDKITVWDSGSGDGKSSTAGFVSNLIKSLPPLHELAGMAGVELPGYLGRVVDGDDPAASPPASRRPPSSPPPRAAHPLRPGHALAFRGPAAGPRPLHPPRPRC